MGSQHNNCYAVFYPMCRDVISNLPDSRRMFLDKLRQHRIGLVIDQHAAGFDLIQEDPELLQVDLEGREDVNMIPGNPRKYCDMREQKVEFWPFFQRACGVFITLTHDHGGMRDIDRLWEPIQPG